MNQPLRGIKSEGLNTNEDMCKQIYGGSRKEGQTHIEKEEQFDFKPPREQTRTEIVKTKKRFYTP